MKLEQRDNSYFITLKKSFENNEVDFAFIKQAFDFAFKMVYEGGFHRPARSGGETERTNAVIFQNTFQGKLAEIVLYENLKLQNIEVEFPDFSIHGKGIWDEADLKANGKSICVKSAAFFSNLLLLETKDWNSEGIYIPNLDNSNIDSYDFFVLVRVKPDIKFVLKETPESKENLWQKIEKTAWYYDIPGCCSIKTIQHIIKNQYVISKNALLNAKTKMDAENYYIQSGDLHDLEDLYSGLREK
ncbi:hypothetical protein [Flavobacterium reichenbachii]|uniref:Restriction endonuclease n=1 Tax=Flavobacterium reichenbachii TaxID=362418 RepID=A0A085ZK95_9FLAO|nr:hypothetical protein [Flavobacterium reichenbachii]KFF04859.1 hypothetical protein IW19_04635 [Flavobacterium reichenbachii]OXB12154.1 hypothetical protein B0A68_19530 [Flavobacterium reichenbachii]